MAQPEFVELELRGDEHHEHHIERQPGMSILDPVAGITSTLAMDVAHEVASVGEPEVKAVNSIKLGTVAGVFLPCLQNIFGIILFLRQAWIVGQAGVLLSILVVAACCLTTLSTCLSMSAIATNGRIPAGGTYYMISRTLGPEFGGAVGLSFYLATTIAAAMYILGGVETITLGLGLRIESLGGFEWQVMGLALECVMGLVVFVGVKVVATIGPMFLAAVIIGISLMWGGALAGFAVGKPGAEGIYNVFTDSQLGSNMMPDFGPAANMAVMFGLFFPSVTGIMAGANRSSALANPSRSIPIGTLLAISITSAVYIINILIFGAAASREKLKNLDSLIVADVAFPHPMIVQIAVLLSTVGAGLQSLTGAPRLLQAIIKDNILPFLGFLAEDPNKEPRKCLACTMVIAGLCILPGNLDIITPIVTMFFLLFYLFTNLACLVLCYLRPPHFRPDWKYYSWWTSVFGMVMCGFQMFLISPGAASGAVIFATVLYLYIGRKGEKHDWGDGVRDVRLQNVRANLLLLDGYGPFHFKMWRPNLLILTRVDYKVVGEKVTGIEMTEEPMMAFVRQLKKGRGLYIMGSLVREEEVLQDGTLIDMREIMTDHVQKQLNIPSFIEVVSGRDLPTACDGLIQIAGIGRYQPNMVVLGFPKRWQENRESREVFLTALRVCDRLHKAVAVFNPTATYPTTKEQGRAVHLWWKPHGGGLLVLLPLLLSLHKVWSKATITVYTLCRPESNSEAQKAKVQHMFKELRFRRVVVETVEFGGDVQTFSYPRTMMQTEGRKLVTAAATLAKEAGSTGFQAQKVSRQAEMNELVSQFDESGSGTPAVAGAAAEDEAGLDLELARRLNRTVLEHSSKADLVVCNLPRNPEGGDPERLLQYCSLLTENFPSFLMIKDGGREVTTSFF